MAFLFNLLLCCYSVTLIINLKKMEENNMKITFLGAGDMFSFGQGHNSVLLNFGETNLIVDFPETNAQSLKKLNIKLTEIENVFITHLHEDHINGLQLLGNYNRVFSKRKTNLFIHEELIDELWQTLKTGMEHTTAGKKTLDDYFDVHIVSKSFSIGDVSFELVKTQHVPGMISHGLCVSPYFYFSGDTTLDRSYLENIEEQVQLIFHECHLQDEVLKSHTSLEEILSLSEKIKEKIVLMHYEDRYSELEERNKLTERTGIKIAGAFSSYSF
jgi:ribonuclease BN (tRNA processing enzyme)